jgi:hypothetical protein
LRIRYSVRSHFFEPLHAALEAHGRCPVRGDPVVVTLSEQGYDGSILVDILAGLSEEFISDWEGRDPTRFPARIRAAATVLHERGCHGRFLISHRRGVLSITAVAE